MPESNGGFTWVKQGEEILGAKMWQPTERVYTVGTTEDLGDALGIDDHGPRVAIFVDPTDAVTTADRFGMVIKPWQYLTLVTILALRGYEWALCLPDGGVGIPVDPPDARFDATLAKILEDDIPF